MSAWLRVIVAMGLLAMGAGLHGQDTGDPVATLDRDRVRLGETVNLTLTADRVLGGAPDVRFLERDFDLLDRSGRSERIAGRSSSVWTFTLRPRVEGVLGIGSIDWAGGRTEPLSVTVLPAARGSADAGDPVYLDVEIDDRSPYVQQAIVFTIRLGYRVALLEGRLEAPDVTDAALRQVGEDLSYQREARGETYRVVERRYVLVPERSGALRIGPARFVGRIQGSGGIYGAFESIAEASDPIELDVRPRPDSAATPWVPAQGVIVEMEPPPAQGRLGDPLTLTLRVRASGVLGSQLPALVLPDGDGYQVFPEPDQTEERVEDGVLVVEATRRFVVVPLSGDRLEIVPSSLDWWDVGRDRAARAAIPGVSLELLAARAGGGFVPPSDGDEGRAPEPMVIDRSPSALPWMLLSLLMGLGWAATTVWLLRRHPRAVVAPLDDATGEDHARRRGGAAARLRRVLAEGDLPAIGDALMRAAPDRAHSLSAVCAQLDDPAQVAAVDAMQAARWHTGDPVAAREQLRRAFGQGPQWRREHGTTRRSADPVPPLYPDRRR